MKNIEVTDEMYTKLIELATEMTTQDMRITKMPHMFQIQTREKDIDWGMNGDYKIYLDDDFDEFEANNEEDLMEIVKLHCASDDIDIPEFEMEYEIEEWIQDKGYKECSYSWRYVYQNTFFTAKACQEHIKLNHYHYNDPKDYLNCAWRNPEMELVSEFLCNLVGKSNHK